MLHRQAAAALAVLALAAFGCRRAREPSAEAGPGADSNRRITVVLAQLPLMLQPGARRALLLSAGEPAAAGSMLSHPLASLDVAGAAVPTADTRLHARFATFERALLAPGPAYDVIVCDAYPTETQMRLAAARLAPGGLLALRAAGPTGPAIKDSLQRALRHLPYVSVWRVFDGEVVLLASRRPPRQVAGLDRLFARAAPAGWLRPLGLSYPATLLSLQAASERSARELAWSRAEPRAWLGLDDRATARGRRSLLLALYLERRRKPLQPREYLEVLLHPRGVQERPVFRGMLEEWVSRYPRDPRALAFLCVVEQREGHADAAAKLRRRLASLRRREPSAARRRIVIPAAT